MRARIGLLFAVALVVMTAPLPAGAQDVDPAAVTSTVSITPNPTNPGVNATATFTFSTDGPDSVRIGAGLLGTNGNGTFTDNGQVPELTNCVMDPTLRAFNCDWNPSGPGQVMITLTVNVSSETPPGSSFEVGSGIGNSFDQTTNLQILAATTTTTMSTTTTTTTTTTTAQIPTPPTDPASAETPQQGGAPLGITG
jgi:hypothetical protein